VNAEVTQSQDHQRRQYFDERERSLDSKSLNASLVINFDDTPVTNVPYLPNLHSDLLQIKLIQSKIKL
jgi:hypothetical protein